MLLTTRMLEDRLSEYGNPRNRIGRMVDAGELIQVRRGLYETDRTVAGCGLAPSIYGPSYLSFEYAMARHGLIPEAVHVFTSATCAKRKSRSYENAYGRYDYQDVPVSVFSLCVELVREPGYPYWIATPEKSLCDKLYKLPPVANKVEFEALLLDDLRIGEDSLGSLDLNAVAMLARRYRCRNVMRLASYLRRM